IAATLALCRNWRDRDFSRGIPSVHTASRNNTAMTRTIVSAASHQRTIDRQTPAGTALAPLRRPSMRAIVEYGLTGRSLSLRRSQAALLGLVVPPPAGGCTILKDRYLSSRCAAFSCKRRWACSFEPEIKPWRPYPSMITTALSGLTARSFRGARQNYTF